MEIILTGKRALVGGSTSGIGRAIALQLAKCGAHVTLMARSEAKLKETLAELDTHCGQQHGILVTDFLDFAGHRRNLETFFAHHSVDIMVNNTQGPAAGDVSAKKLPDYQQAFDLLFQNAVYATQLALPHMEKQGYGRIIQVSSMTVKEPQDTLVLSNTMRTALVSWSKTLANAVAHKGITVNSILTGYFDTDRLTSLMQQQADAAGLSLAEIRQQREATVPTKRLGDPAEYGYLVAFLASPYAAFLTGAALPLDGGIARTLF